MKKFFSVLFIGIISLCLIGCGMKDSALPSGDYDSTGKEGGYFDDTATRELTPTSDGKDLNDSSDFIMPKIFRGTLKRTSGMLTASLVDDNEKYDFWTKLISASNDQQQTNESTSFNQYYSKYSFKTLDRIKLEIKGVNSATITLTDDGEYFSSTTDGNGMVYLFPNMLRASYNVKVTYPTNDGMNVKEFNVKNNDVISIDDAVTKEDRIELMFVVDTTGSMGDELEFLKLEMDDVISKVQKNNPNSSISVALLFYRDFGDQYVTKYFDFTSDIEQQKLNIKLQNANGGGDFEEAVHKALAEAVSKNWSTTPSTKLLVHIADAPSHDSDVSAWNAAIVKLASMGVKVITVASSGIDKKTEYFFRSQSLLTGGKYIYLTNDSGIGNGHIEATTEEKPVVEYLNALLVRVINGYHTGDFGKAVPYYDDSDLNTLPEKMPDDFSFTIEWNKGLKDKYDSKTGELVLNINVEETQNEIIKTKKIVLTKEKLEKVYDILKTINYSKVVSDEETPSKTGLKITIKAENYNYTCYLGTEEDIYLFDNSASYAMYVKLNSILVAVINMPETK